MAIEMPGLQGSGPNVQLIDPGGAPATIIDTGNPFTLRIDWSVLEPGAGLLGGRWVVRAYAESLGPGQEKQIGPTRNVNVSSFTPVAGPPASRRYTTDVVVGAGELEAESDAPQRSGVYKLVVIVTHENPAGAANATEVAGFSEGPVIQLREP